MDVALMRRRVAEARVGRLGTVGEDGRPHLVPVCFVLDGDSVYWAVDHKPKATRDLKRLRNLAANPAVELLVDHYEEAWDRIWWVRVRCQAAVLEPGSESANALDLLAAKYAQYGARRPEGPVVKMAARHWTGWSGEGIDA